jgi:hypothetical protein
MQSADAKVITIGRAADNTVVPHASAFPNAIIAVCTAVIAVAVLWLALPGDGEAPADTAAAAVSESTETPTEDAIESYGRGIQDSEPQTPAGDNTIENSQAGSDPVEAGSSTNGQQETDAAFDATQAMFVVYCRQAETRTPFRVGTAFAIDDGRVVTSASVIYSLKTLMQNSFTEPTLYSPTQRQSFDITEMHAHAEFESLTAQIDALRGTSDNEKQMVSLLNQRTAFDIGTLQTKERLTVGLKAHSENPRPGQKLRVVGYAFDVDDPFFDASLTPQADEMAVRSDPLQFPDGLSSATFSGRISGNQTDQTNLAFIGSPILNASDLVIGVYVRQTPGTENIERFDGSLISQLAEEISQ